MLSRLRPAFILSALALGLFFPGAAAYKWVIPRVVQVMLWFIFLEVGAFRFRRQHALLLLLNWAVGLAAWRLVLPWSPSMAAAALIIGLTPTATAAPVITRMLGGEVEFTALSVLLTNSCAGLLFPLALPWLLHSQVSIPFLPFLQNLAVVIFLPLALGQGMRRFLPGVSRICLRWKGISFYLWLGLLFVAAANAGAFLRIRHGAGEPWGPLAVLFLLALAICLTNFGLGRWLGGAYSRETSQSLGQKNTGLTIWISLAYISPLAALGVTFYVFCHNAYNAAQMAVREIKN